MPMKGAIQPNHIPVNKYRLIVAGLPTFTMTTVSGIEEELEVVTLPDRTNASGGNTKAGEFTVKIPMHHKLEQAAMEAWFRESQDPVLPTYKKAGTLIHEPVGIPGIPRNYSLLGLFPSKRKLPDLDMKNEGEMAEVEWTLKWDDVLPA